MSGLTKFLMYEVEMPIVEVVTEMEDTGYLVDTAFFANLRAQLEPKIEEARNNICTVAGDDNFNPNSPKQLQSLLYKTLKLKIPARPKKNGLSTDKKTLERLKSKHEVIARILEFRKLNKIISTYCCIPEQVDVDGRLRVEFNQLAAETGRFSSNSVIQTIPKKNDEYGLRKGFRAPDGHSIVGADFRQQELNVLAQVSGDKNLLEAIETGLDLHGLAAVKVFGLDCQPNEVDDKFPDKRDQIKAIQFGLIYGKTAHGLATSLSIYKDEAQQLIDDYFSQFPAVKKFVTTVHHNLLRQGYVDDVFGRRRHFPVVKQKVPRKRYHQLTAEEKGLLGKINAAKRQAQNFVIQGASATVTKLAMIRCFRHITNEYGDGVKMILTLHDELQFEVRNDLVLRFVTELPGLMCGLGLERFGFKLPLSVEVKVGPSWGEMTRWKGNEESKDGETTNIPQG